MKKNCYSIAEILKFIIEQSSLEYGLLKIRTENAWKQIMSKNIVQHTENLVLKDKVLYVTLNSAALKQNLLYESQTIVKELNKALSGNFIEKIIFK